MSHNISRCGIFLFISLLLVFLLLDSASAAGGHSAIALHNRLFAQFGAPREQVTPRNVIRGDESYVAHSKESFGREEPRRKSKALAVVLSAAVPGSGEIYCGSYIKGLGFLAVETTCWVVYGVYTKEGNEIEDEFHNFADTHWIEADYWDWISDRSGLPRDDMEALREYERDNFSHGLHEQKDQQYYEMIGKYDQFNVGWDDTLTPFARDSQRRDFYETRRDDSNKAFKKAAAGEMIALANHLLSALDAAWTVNNYNKKMVTTSLRVTPSRYALDHAPMLCLRVDW